jgi:protein-S-isoprenylcysteine O-methyltransferase Ste14
VKARQRVTRAFRPANAALTRCATIVVVLLLAAPRVALACPVCFGQNDSPLATAMNLGIIAMLAVVVGVLAAFAYFFIYLMRRARLVARTVEETAR